MYRAPANGPHLRRSRGTFGGACLKWVFLGLGPPWAPKRPSREEGAEGQTQSTPLGSSPSLTSSSTSVNLPL